jgi:hypothetical protein
VDGGATTGVLSLAVGLEAGLVLCREGLALCPLSGNEWVFRYLSLIFPFVSVLQMSLFLPQRVREMVFLKCFKVIIKGTMELGGHTSSC